MGKYGRFFAPVLLFLGMALLAGPRWFAAASQGPESPYQGWGHIDGALSLTMVVDPPITTPGSPLNLTVTLSNLASVTHAPTLTFRLPPALRLQGQELPAGATFNVADQRLRWEPIVPANGGQLQFSLALVADTAVINQPEQAVTVALTYDDVAQTTEALVWVGVLPQIANVLVPPQAAVGQPVQLEALLAGSGPFTQTWDLGDGRQLTVADPEVVFPAAGFYDVTVTVTNPLGSVSRTRTINIVPHPAAQFSAADETVLPDAPVQFQNHSGGQTPLVYEWRFGDGATSNEPSPTHVYESPGIYPVQLTVQNNFGVSEAFLEVVVGQPPQASMTLPTSGRMGEPVIGQAEGDASVTGYRWDLGNGRFLEGTTISHVYTQSGTYYVRLQAENEFGTVEVGQWVRIEPGMLSLYLPLVHNSSAGAAVANGSLDGDLAVNPDLPEVALDAPFVLAPLDLPPELGPAERLFVYINEARAQFDLPPVALVPSLNQAAQQHTADMARFGYTAHVGYDGSVPAERLLWQGYDGGYAGEATAWGFEFAYEAVEFWVNSPSHRRIILNEFATDVGVGFAVDFSAPNVWYWTAEFGNTYAAAMTPQLRLQGPLPETEVFLTDPLDFTWNWPLPLEPGQQFVVSVSDGQVATQVGTTAVPLLDTRYGLTLALSEMVAEPGAYQWQVRLVGNGQAVAESPWRSLALAIDPNLPTPTPTPAPTTTVTPTVVSPTATPAPTQTPPAPTSTPPPPPATQPPLVTATPGG